MDFITTCPDCSYEANSDSEEGLRQQIKDDGGKVEYLGGEQVTPPRRKNQSQKVKVYDLHCPSGHRLSGIVPKKHRDRLPLTHWRNNLSRRQNS